MYRFVRFAERLTNYNPAEELVLIVDRENQPVGSATRSEMRAKRLLHRSSFIFVQNSDGKLYVQMRTSDKDTYPSYYDPATGGVVLASDPSDEISARRELQEEIGISPANIDFLFNHYYQDSHNNVWCSVFYTQYDGELIIQPEEVQWIELMTVQEIFSRSLTQNFCPDAMEILKILYNQGKIN
jgi:isopentenyldiphosphate isomerase